MKRLVKQAFCALSIFLFNSCWAQAEYADPIIGLIFPGIGIEYVDRLPDGHLRKNKPRYGKFDWRPKESAHFIIYTYGNDELANFFLNEAEKVYAEFCVKPGVCYSADKFKIEIHSSARDFEETNLIFGLVPKGLGGRTEMIKRKRVTVAFRDSVVGFRRLLRHELAHRYHAELIKLSLFDLINGKDIPSWFIEGAAEHLSHKWDAAGELAIRDAYINDYLARPSDEMSWWSNGLVYKQGEFVLHYLAKKYQDKGDVVSAIFKESKELKFEEAFYKVIGKTLEEFDDELRQYIESRYYQIRAKTDIVGETKELDEAVLLAVNKESFVTRKNVFGRNRLSVNWTDGDRVYSKKLADDVRIKTVSIRGFGLEIEPEFGYQEQGASFASADVVVYAVDIGGKDAIISQQFSFDKKNKEFILGDKEIYRPEGIRDIQYPVVIGKDKIAFVGRKDVFAEIYVFDKSSNKLAQLTSARRTYRGLSYSEKLNLLVTSVENEISQSYDLAVYDLRKNDDFRLLAQTDENEFSAEFSPDGEKLLYVSDKGLVHNIYLYDFNRKENVQLTDVKIGVFRPHWFGGEGMLFNAFSEGRLFVKGAPVNISAEEVKFSSGADNNYPAGAVAENGLLIKKFSSYLPESEELSVFEAIASSDGTKALFLANKKLSMEKLKRGESEIEFYLADSASTETLKFTIEEFKRLEEFGKVEFLAGSNILLQKDITLIQQKKEGNSYYETEFDYKESYVYDWKSEKLYELEIEQPINLFGCPPTIFKISPESRYLAWTECTWNENSRIMIYDSLEKKKSELNAELYKVFDFEFTAGGELFVFDQYRTFRVSRIRAATNSQSVWNIESPDLTESENGLAWYPLPDGERIFFLSYREEQKSHELLMLDTRFSSASVISRNIPIIKQAAVMEDKFLVETVNQFGLKRILTVDKSGKVEIQDEALYYAVRRSSFSDAERNLLSRQELDASRKIKNKEKKLDRFPRLYDKHGAAVIGVNSRGGAGGFVVLEMVALDELNNKAVVANLFLQRFNQGFADVSYYNFTTGRSLNLNYWNFDANRQRLDVGIFQNIFIHPLINWDITLKEEYVSLNGNLLTQWWRTKLETTFSLDTTISDWHGPHSGFAVFSRMAVGLDNWSRYQGADANLDVRYYCPFTKRSGLAFKLAGGYSFGPTSTVFVWGGNSTFRGVPLFSQSGNAYALNSSELRFPMLDLVGAKISGPVDEAFQYLIRYFDVRGGLYNDVGDIWHTKKSVFGQEREKFKIQQSAGIFVNVPTAFGLNLRFNKGYVGEKGWNFWLGYNW